MARINTTRSWRATGTALLAVLIGCGEKVDTATATQAAARVDGSEISVHQINFALSRLPGLEAAKAEQTGKQVLEQLIDQELLIKKAVDAKLDREPRIMQAIEESKRQILAQAYLEKVMSGGSDFSQDEVAKFFKERPELFAQRRQFRYAELSAPVNGPVVEELKQKLSSGSNINDVAKFLKDKSIVANGATFERTSEQLPMDLLPRLHQLKAGQIALLQGRGRASVIQMLEVKDIPLDETRAKPLIERYLTNQKRMQLAQSEVKQLREHAKIEYLGKFQAPDTKAVSATAVAPQSVDGVKSAVEVKPDFVEEGLSGLK